MPIHEQSLIRPENLKTHEKLVMDGVAEIVQAH